MNREYYSQDKILFAKQTSLVHKLERDVEVCKRCGFNENEIYDKLLSSKNKYNDLIGINND